MELFFSNDPSLSAYTTANGFLKKEHIIHMALGTGSSDTPLPPEKFELGLKYQGEMIVDLALQSKDNEYLDANPEKYFKLDPILSEDFKLDYDDVPKLEKEARKFVERQSEEIHKICEKLEPERYKRENIKNYWWEK